jgi:6-phosphogluconolactonase
MPEWTVFKDAEAVAQAASERIQRAADAAIRQHGFFRLVVAGGGTPKLAYKLLASSDSQWQYWHLYFGDERCLPAGHPDRNSQMVHDSLSGQVPIPAAQIHPIRAESGAGAAARDYQALLQDVRPFQMVLLGLGEDGHTASLFPGQEHLTDELAVPVHDAPKPPSDRVSLSAKALGDTENLLFLVTGEGKRDAVRRWRANDSIPANTITTRGRAEVLIDQEAWTE